MAKTLALCDACPMELGQITTKTLTHQLRELEEQRIIRRTVYPEIPPRVEYETLEPVLKALCGWGTEYLWLMERERE